MRQQQVDPAHLWCSAAPRKNRVSTITARLRGLRLNVPGHLSSGRPTARRLPEMLPPPVATQYPTKGNTSRARKAAADRLIAAIVRHHQKKGLRQSTKPSSRSPERWRRRAPGYGPDVTSLCKRKTKCYHVRCRRILDNVSPVRE